MRVLDHGYVKLIETWGSDERIVEAARMSTQKGFNGWGTPDAPGDEKLLRFLHANNHATPFEMAGLIVEVQAPIFVFREWHRHRTQSYNEASARYEPLPDLDYTPTLDRMLYNAGGMNRQAGTVAGADVLTKTAAAAWLDRLETQRAAMEQTYKEGLEIGVPKELARLAMTVGRYSKMRASANLRNWLGFLMLRMDVKAQWEIRQYANAVGEIVKESFPRTWDLFSSKFYGAEHASQ